MRLELAVTRIRDVRLADETRVREGTLYVNARELETMLLKDPRLKSVEIDVARPGEDCRIAHVFDIVEPRARIDGSNFPGALGPLVPVGVGRTSVLRGAAVVEINAMGDFYDKIIDMSGPGTAYSHFSRTCNITLLANPAPDISQPQYYHALKSAGLRTSVYLAQCARDVQPDEVEVYDLPGRPQPVLRDSGLPRVAYIYMLHSHQRPTEVGEPVFYGDNVRALLPTIVHPNEILDGAVLCGYWNLGLDTYTIQNHPVITELYAQHQRELDFAGVIVTVAYASEEERERSTMMAAKLAKHVLAADGVILTKVGGGIPETDLMLTCERCEEMGIRATALAWSHSGGSVDGSLTYFPPRADAIVSVGMYEDKVRLPAVATVIGGSTVGPFEREASVVPLPAHSALELGMRHIAGGFSQIGGSPLRVLEY